ncbi:hypothetical protein [Mesonia maritima]|uniref:Tfp pilus assembly protein PilP n=1 Tax=Mesonia maritima TaxID=1793873 RepID=A0ABU1K1V9_9FLAO|nr:hypothetical protein [Mesonia maritima]MDR6299606.1 Tfp pilus assembly protein PilP [Mesonia maritima]
MKKTIVFFVIILAVLACKNSEKSSTEEMQEVEMTAHSKVNQSPCELLTDAEIKKALAIPADAETSKVKKNTTYPACFYKWESITFPYEVFNRHMTNRPAEMSIVWAINVNKKLYKQSIAVYKDGEAIDNVGEMAIWSEKMGQITFLKGGNLIHVKAEISADNAFNKAKSIKVAKLFANKL